MVLSGVIEFMFFCCIGWLMVVKILNCMFWLRFVMVSGSSVVLVSVMCCWLSCWLVGGWWCCIICK